MIGALGKMGTRIRSLALKDPGLKLIGGVDIKEDAKNNVFTSLGSVKADYDCIIDFTSPKATMTNLKEAERLGKGIIIGTTGLSGPDEAAIKKAAEKIPVVLSPNMSVGVNILFNLIEKCVKIFGAGYNVSIKESHHRHKKDSPSGTAKMMAKIAENYGASGKIAIEATREGEIIGEHEIVFESEVDTLKISHSAKTRDIFVLGALKAALFLKGKKKGFFTMKDVLGLEAS